MFDFDNDGDFDLDDFIEADIEYGFFAEDDKKRPNLLKKNIKANKINSLCSIEKFQKN